MPALTDRDRRALVTLSFIEARIDVDGSKGSDRIELFMPLIYESLRAFLGTSFSLEDFSGALERDHGLILPGHLIDTLLRRCCKAGLLRRTDGCYSETGKPIPFRDTTADKARIEGNLDELILALQDYAGERLGISLTCDEIQSLLFAYLVANFGNVTTTGIPHEGKVAYSGDWRWIEMFFSDPESANPERVKTVVSIMRGLVVHDAAFFPEFTSGTPSMRGLRVYLDTPLICRALGLASIEDEKHAREMISDVRSAGASCHVYEQTCEEVRGVLYAIHEGWGELDRNMNPASFAYHVHRRGYARSEIWEMLNGLEALVSRRLGASIEATPTRKRQYVLDEKSLARRLEPPEDAPPADKRIRHDINCIAAILTERAGAQCRSLSKSKAVFATVSPKTVRNVQRWWVEDEKRDDIPPIFSMIDLANLAWLAKPNEVGEDLHRKTLVVSCASGLMPSEAVWERCMERFGTHVQAGEMTEADVAAIIVGSDLSSQLSEMDVRGVLAKEGDMAYEKAIEQAKDAIAAERVESVRRESNQRVRDVERDKRMLEESMQTLKDNTSEEIAKLASQNESYREAVVKNAERRARQLVNTLACVLVVVAIVLAIVLVPGIIATIDDGSFTASAVVQIVLTAIPAVLAVITRLDSVKKWLTDRVMKAILPEDETTEA